MFDDDVMLTSARHYAQLTALGIKYTLCSANENKLVLQNPYSSLAAA
jgi:hypothetical protein